MESPAKVAAAPEAVTGGDLLPALEAAGLLRHMRGTGARFLELQARRLRWLVLLAGCCWLAGCWLAGSWLARSWLAGLMRLG
jgi:hypothetical protein